jgi:hypothetical protein
MNFFDCLISLNDKDKLLLKNHYGDKWYSYFFLSEHITFSIQSIIKNAQKRTDIINSYGSDWYNTHIVKNIHVKRSEYNYGTIFENNQYIKYKTKDDDIPDDENNYKIVNTDIIAQFGGNDDDEEEDEEEETIDSDDLTLFDKFNEKTDGKIVDIDESYDIDEMNNELRTEDTQIDKNPNSIKQLIEQALEKTNTDLNEKRNRVSHFDKSKSNLVYDDLLKQNYEKHFVYANYIFKSDTIKVIKQKNYPQYRK